MKRLSPPSSTKLDDSKAESARREHAEKIVELQGVALTVPDVLSDKVLKDGVETPISHKLGRSPRFVKESCVRGAVTTGHVEEIRAGKYDRTKTIVLKAVGWGADITVDVEVM